ncbi:MAG: winged helix DNA-binding domain-containing protein [Hydrogenophaga sp.]|uniref:DNA glycosylase AlkZ-like family protein n=1 Tax=Hydrogenophaga sp. TaxID=1904254 RepID=UPI00262EB3D4|nr:crosslink repair DNA glycosylase YcaQ family protein [Hydrogenophaga sp.]MCV0437938.1 winged helix DNA-binding domain-containing protein [Hydrogenophaga sp.]
MARSPTLAELRRYAIARSLFKPVTLPAAIRRLGFVQADPMRAPARAQDLILFQRVRDYRAGDLERRYERLAIEEDAFVNYGFVPREMLALLHPRTPRQPWDEATVRRAREVLDFVRERGAVHPREVGEVFVHHGRVPGYWGGELNASTRLLEHMHHHGWLRVRRRESGTRVYEAIRHAEQDESPSARLARAQALVDAIVALYAPIPSPSLGYLVTLLRYGAPHLSVEARAVVKAARERYGHAVVDGTTWFWPADENPVSRRHQPGEGLRFLAPFDPVVWDRRRFEMLWGWAYRFEAYVPAAKRTMGHYALPVLWGEQVVGWANMRVERGHLRHQLGFAGARARDAGFQRALDEELARFEIFLEQGN